METFIKWIDRPLVLDWIAVSSGLLTLVFTGMYFCFDKGDWASWVQAVGSMVAIGVALYLSDSGFRKAVAVDLEKQRKVEWLRLKHINSLVAVAHREALDLFNALSTNDMPLIRKYDYEVLSDIRTTLDDLPKFEIPDSEVVFGIVRLCRHLKVVEQILKRSLDHVGSDDAVFCTHLHNSELLRHTCNMKDYARLAQEKVVTALGDRSR